MESEVPWYIKFTCRSRVTILTCEQNKPYYWGSSLYRDSKRFRDKRCTTSIGKCQRNFWYKVFVLKVIENEVNKSKIYSTSFCVPKLINCKMFV